MSYTLLYDYVYIELAQEEQPKQNNQNPQPIPLPSGDPQDYVADYLYKILPRIINPTGKKYLQNTIMVHVYVIGP